MPTQTKVKISLNFLQKNHEGHSKNSKGETPNNENLEQAVNNTIAQRTIEIATAAEIINNLNNHSYYSRHPSWQRKRNHQRC